MDATTLWDRMLEAMQKRIGHQDVEIWLRPGRPRDFDGHTLVVEVDNRYYHDWIAENYFGHLREVGAGIAGAPIDVDLVADEDPPTSEGPLPVPPPIDGGETQRAIGLNTRQNFESFVIGECNKFAHAAAGAVANFPATQYNPLFIYGPTGLGKTHLMHAIGNEILRRDPTARVVYVTAEDFLNEMINCLRYKRMEDFRNKYRRRATVLLVDDIQFLSGRDRTQEEFFHTFNALVNSNRQVVLTADVLPRNIDKLEPRLRTRFEGGLLADLQPPDKETLMAILHAKAEAQGIRIPGDLADAIANKVHGNIRELEGILNKLVAMRAFYHEPLSLEFARTHMPNVFAPTATTVTVAAIIEAVARIHNLRSADITGDKRTRNLTRPRHIAMYLARTHTILSFPELGKEFGDRDHSTIQHGFRKVEKELRDDADLAYKIRLIEQSLQLRGGSS